MGWEELFGVLTGPPISASELSNTFSAVAELDLLQSSFLPMCQSLVVYPFCHRFSHGFKEGLKQSWPFVL